MRPIIKVENLSKQYRIGAHRARYGTLRESITEAVSMPFRRLRRNGNSTTEETIWALKDVSFDVSPGEVVGIIGRNGAGKSTLLKVLSRITEPTTGAVDIYGRVGSLLEVGTGFHPELTGRENLYLSGAILGMKKAEIKRRFDEIVAFAEVEKFVDTPVKHYSSGMYVRLAFAVAAYLEPDVLLVDEVLAVGDAQFQQKCLGKMGDVAREGRTVLFVSHNMTAINKLCQRAIMLTEGQILHDGKATHIVSEYLKTASESSGEQVWDEPHRSPGNDKIRLHAVRIVSDGKVTGDVDIDQDVSVEVEFWNFAPDARNICTNIYLLDGMGTIVLSTATTPSANLLTEEWFGRPHPVGLFRATCTIPGNFLNEGLYYITVYMVTLGPISLEAEAQQVLSFNVFDTGAMRDAGGGKDWHGVVRVRLPWQTEFLQPLVNPPVTKAEL